MGEYFYENLKLAREQKGLSQKDVAEKIGVAKSTYSLYESGNREPNVQTIKKLQMYWMFQLMNYSELMQNPLLSPPTSMVMNIPKTNWTKSASLPSL